jgi:hypothetical protein
MPMRLGVWGIVSLVVLALAPAAYAGQRFAAPAGTGTECTQEKPCSLSEAVMAAKAGDEVIVGAGTYPLTSSIFAPLSATNVQIHGEPSGPMPRLTAAFPGNVVGLTQAGDSLSYVEIENDANAGDGLLCIGGRLERVRVRVVGTGGIGAFVSQDCAVRNSLFRVEGGSSTGLRAASAGGGGKTSASVRNATVIASGSGSSGVTSEYNDGSPGSFTLELENSIAQGTEQDLKTSAGANGPGNIAAGHSNFDTTKPVGEAKVIDGGGNQTAPPVYVDAENGDFREASGSPTIDGGIADQLGPLDLAGNTRILGPAPDIGAFEFVPPAAVPPPPVGQIQSLSLKPTKFRAGNVSGAIASSKKPAAPLGTSVSYSLSAAASVSFTLQKLTPGRKVGGKCVKPTRLNKGHGKCVLTKPVKGGFSNSGAAGQNQFKFSGRIGGRSLAPGSYRLMASAGGASRTANFKIVK